MKSTLQNRVTSVKQKISFFAKAKSEGRAQVVGGVSGHNWPGRNGPTLPPRSARGIAILLSRGIEGGARYQSPTFCRLDRGFLESWPRSWLTATIQGTATEKAKRARMAWGPKRSRERPSGL